jgi:hypothetical protein
MTIRPKNWTQFQHYKSRRPPWIRLYRSLLDDFEFQRLPLASKALAPLLWLLASESMTGEIDGDVPRLAFRLRMSEQQVSEGLTPLLHSQFFERVQDASSAQASRSQVATPETEQRQSRAEGDSRARDHSVPCGTIEAGDALTRTPSAEDVLAEMSDSWKADVDGVNVEALQRFFDFVAREINPPSKRKEFSPSARIATAKKLAGMGDTALQAQVVEQSIANDHATLYALKDRPSKQAASAAQSIADQRREMSGLRVRAEAIKFRPPHRGEDVKDYRYVVERAERDAKEKTYRDGIAKRGPLPIAKLLIRRTQ